MEHSRAGARPSGASVPEVHTAHSWCPRARWWNGPSDELRPTGACATARSDPHAARGCLCFRLSATREQHLGTRGRSPGSACAQVRGQPAAVPLPPDQRKAQLLTAIAKEASASQFPLLVACGCRDRSGGRRIRGARAATMLRGRRPGELARDVRAPAQIAPTWAMISKDWDHIQTQGGVSRRLPRTSTQPPRS